MQVAVHTICDITAVVIHPICDVTTVDVHPICDVTYIVVHPICDATTVVIHPIRDVAYLGGVRRPNRPTLNGKIGRLREYLVLGGRFGRLSVFHNKSLS